MTKNTSDNSVSETLLKTLRENHQEHLLEALKASPSELQSSLKERLQAINWADLKNFSSAPDLSTLSSSRVIDGSEREQRAQELVKAGESLYTQNKVAALMVAGGQGSRLGYDGPKGCYTITPGSKKPLYQVHSEKVLAASKKYDSRMPLVIMTSPATDSETRDFYQKHDNFGLADSQVLIFSQGTVPTCSLDGQALLSEPGKLLENPDGHGGCYAALLASGTLKQLVDQGIDT